MKKSVLLLAFFIVFSGWLQTTVAQCSVCTRSTEQMGETPAGKINAGILYLAAAPLLIAGVVGYRWWKRNGS